MFWAETEHGITRAGDPSRHTHAILMNMVHTKAGDWRALETRELFRHMHLIGSIYLSALREKVHEAGYPTRDGKGEEGNFEIVGFGKDQLAAFSQRTQQIEVNIQYEEQAIGRELSGAERQLMRMRDRPAKPQEPRAVLSARWQETAQSVGLDLSDIQRQAEARGQGHHVEAHFEGKVSAFYSGLLKLINPQDMPHETARGAIAQGLAQVEERSAVFSRHDVMAAAMKAADYRLGLAAYDQAYAALVKKGDILPADKSMAGGITTARAVALERDVV
jgi:hypothetical protein